MSRSPSLLLIAASMFAAATGTATAGWVPVKTGDPQVVTTFEAKTAGKSGNVKACFETTTSIQAFTWTQSQTGATRGTFDVSTPLGTTQVPTSNCQ